MVRLSVFFFGASGVCGAEYAEVCGTPAANGGIAVCFGFPGAFSAASGVRPGNVESASSRLTAVTAEWQTGHSTRLPTQAALTAKELPQIWQRQGTASCSSVSGLGFSSCLAVTEAVQMGHFTWRPRKDASTPCRRSSTGRSRDVCRSSRRLSACRFPCRRCRERPTS